MSIEIRNVGRRFGDYTALEGINLNVQSGELVSLLGPSGSGKTTLLRIIAGLERADTGSVLLDGKDATDIPVRHRRVGFVFQQYALFRHMTVYKNIAFGLSVLPRSERPSASPIALLPVAQAVTGASTGPFSPYRMLTCAAAMLAIIIGTSVGLTRPGPRSSKMR